MKIVGIIGDIGSGKTTLAKMLQTRHDGIIIPFAKPLKDLAKSLGWNGEKDEKGRRLLQLLGTDILRNCIDPEWHTKRWYEIVLNAYGSGKQVIIADDVRFINEVENIRSKGGFIVRIIGRRYGNVPSKIDNFIYNQSRQHSSELAMKAIKQDLTIDNSGSFTQLSVNMDLYL